jgi:hypothetical protein
MDSKHIYLDEQFLKEERNRKALQKILQEQENSTKIIEDIKEGEALIEDKKITFKRKQLFTEISLLLPETFEENKVDANNYIFSNQTMDVHLIATSHHGKSKEFTLKEYKKNFASKMHEEAKTAVKWVEEGVYVAQNKKIIYTAYTCPIEDTFSYNFIFIIPWVDKLFVMNFSCMEERFESWQRVGKGMMETIQIEEKEGEDVEK